MFWVFRQQQQISGAALPASPNFSSNEIRKDILRKAQKAEKGGNRSAQFAFLKHSYLHEDHAIALGGAKSNKIPIMTLKKPENTKSPS